MVTRMTYNEYYGLTSDERPKDDVPNGATYYEIDGDHRVFMWDAGNKAWVEQ